jgi:hypothetical protein
MHGNSAQLKEKVK